MESRIQDCPGFPCMRQNVSQTRPDRKKADSLLVYATFAHRGSVAPLNVILRPYTSSETYFRRAFCLDPTDCPWVSEYGLYTAKSKKVALVIGIWAYRTMQ